MLEVIKKEMEDKSVSKKWIYVVMSLFALYGIINVSFNIYKIIKELSSPTKMIAYVQSADYQDQMFDRFSVNFRNPTKDDGSINNFVFWCEKYSGEEVYLNVANNEQLFKQAYPSFEVMPINIKKGESKTIQIYVLKAKDSPLVNETCRAITPVWSNTDLNRQEGKTAMLNKGSISSNFTN